VLEAVIERPVSMRAARGKYGVEIARTSLGKGLLGASSSAVGLAYSSAA
jgi:hypothetical protein